MMKTEAFNETLAQKKERAAIKLSVRTIILENIYFMQKMMYMKVHRVKLKFMIVMAI